MDMDVAGHWLLLCNEEEIAVEEDNLRLAGAALAIICLGSDEVRELRRERRRATRQYLTRPELLTNPRLTTPWQKLFESQNDPRLHHHHGFWCECVLGHLEGRICGTMVSHSHSSHRHSRNCTGPPVSSLSWCSRSTLGLVLHYLSSTMREVSLQEIFALIPSTVSRYILFALRILHDTLCDIPETTITWPRNDDFEAFSILIQQRHPLLVGAFASIDGLNVPVQTSSDQESRMQLIMVGFRGTSLVLS